MAVIRRWLCTFQLQATQVRQCARFDNDDDGGCKMMMMMRSRQGRKLDMFWIAQDICSFLSPSLPDCVMRVEIRSQKKNYWAEKEDMAADVSEGHEKPIHTTKSNNPLALFYIRKKLNLINEWNDFRTDNWRSNHMWTLKSWNSIKLFILHPFLCEKKSNYKIKSFPSPPFINQHESQSIWKAFSTLWSWATTTTAMHSGNKKRHI